MMTKTKIVLRRQQQQQMRSEVTLSDFALFRVVFRLVSWPALSILALVLGVLGTGRWPDGGALYWVCEAMLLGGALGLVVCLMRYGLTTPTPLDPKR